jgi:parallel beta-helix repeat protein
VLVSGGGSAEVRMNHITAIRDHPLSGVQEGIGVQFGLTDSKGTVLSTGTGEARMNLIDDYQKGGVVVIGAGSDANVTHNTITGVGPTDVIAQNGVQVSHGATADVEGNFISGNNYTPGTFVSEGILVFETAGVTVRHNSLVDNNEGILLYFTDDSTVEHNIAVDNTLNGIGLWEAEGNVVRHNKASDNGQDGINVFDSDDNRVENNFTFGNERYGIGLEGTSTGNFIARNHLGDNDGGDLFVGNPDNTLKNNHFQSHGQGGGGHRGNPHPRGLGPLGNDDV